MDIHVVQPGDTLYRIAQQYGVPMSRLLLDNRPPDPGRLAVGQALVVQYPQETLILQPGETLAQAGREEEILAADLDFSVIDGIRSSINVFRDRRPELYHV